MNSFINKLAIALIFAASANAVAVSPTDTPDLIAAREEHLRTMQRLSIPTLTAYLKTLDRLKFQYTREAKLEAALAVSNEIQSVTQQLETAKKAAERSGPVMQLVIVSASYESADRKRKTDITKNVRKHFDAGTPTLKMNTAEGAANVDPAPFVPKQTTIIYMKNGQRKELILPEGKTLNFKEDLN